MKELLTIGRNLNAPPQLQELAFKYLYILTKVSAVYVVITPKKSDN